MDEGPVASNMKTISIPKAGGKPSIELDQVLHPKPIVIKPDEKNGTGKIIPMPIKAEPVAEVVNPEPIAEIVKPKHVHTDELKKEEKALQEIYNMLEDVRLNLIDSKGQGFLMNASATISNYIRMTYRPDPVNLPTRK